MAAALVDQLMNDPTFEGSNPANTGTRWKWWENVSLGDII
jgi:hypothetical protein